MMYKGVVHVHSTHSYDGKLTLEDIKAQCLSRGLSFACMTEHTDAMTEAGAAAFVAACRAYSDDSFVFVPGFEVPYGAAHVLHIGATKLVAVRANSAVELSAWRAVTPVVVLAHPVRNGFIVDAPLRTVVDGIEVWNQQYEGKRAPRTRSIALLNELRIEKKLVATGGIDLHRTEHLGSPYTMIELAALNEDAIVQALRLGKYTFGNDTYTIHAQEVWRPSWRARIQSAAACMTITGGKAVNKALASMGVRLPTSLVRLIRARV